MTRFLSLFSFIVLLLVGRPVIFGQTIQDDDYLVRICDTATGDCGYANLEGETIIPLWKYSVCFTDTFRIYAIVSMLEKGFVAINRQEKILYEVFPFDNGPDYPKEGLFRIRIGDKIGYADEITGKAYSLFKINGISKLCEISLETGEIINENIIPNFKYIENIKVRNGFVYFLYRINSPLELMKLYKMEI